MKKTIFFIILLLVSLKINAQVGIGTINPNPAAALDIESTDKGFLPPRVTNVAAIATPVAGLMIYDNSQQCMRYYNGTIWSNCMGGIVPPTFTCGDPMTDIDGNTYPTVLIGGQCWMAADLKVSKYPNGDAIPYIDNNLTWGALGANNTDDAYCFYRDSNNNGVVDIAFPDYGALYNYAAAIADNWTRDNNAKQGVCPDGWHLPSEAEWATLTTFLGGTSVAGGEMKEAGFIHWDTPNTGATNDSGFTALPGGTRKGFTGTFSSEGFLGHWRVSTEFSPTSAKSSFLFSGSEGVNNGNTSKNNGFSVRCLKD